MSKHAVFVSKVLKRLYPPPPPSDAVPQERAALLAQERKEQCTSSSISLGKPSVSGAGVDIHVPRKIYTVSLPPAEYIAGPSEATVIRTESSDNEESSNGEDPQRKVTRKHRPKRRLKKALKGDTSENTEHELQKQSGLQESSPHSIPDRTTMSKNKKRKLKKKRHKEKVRAAGILKSTAVEITYQPKEDSYREDESEDIPKKAAEILDFLQATLEIYYADNKSKPAASFLVPETVHCILHQLETCSMPSSDVTLLCQLKSLVILQDTDRLKKALDEFQECSMMPDEEAKTICSLFHYWITDILPVAGRK